MIGYTMVGTKNLKHAKAFYNPLFDLRGLSPCYEDDQVASWGDRQGKPAQDDIFTCTSLHALGPAFASPHKS